jgi:hypothetical protein
MGRNGEACQDVSFPAIGNRCAGIDRFRRVVEAVLNLLPEVHDQIADRHVHVEQLEKYRQQYQSHQGDHDASDKQIRDQLSNPILCKETFYHGIR